MRFMVIVHSVSAKDFEAGKMPTPEMLEKMGKFNERLVDAGIMEMGDGLAPSNEAIQLHFAGNAKVTKETTGTTAAPEHRVNGFWIWKVKSKDEALSWARQTPMENGDILELRRIMEAEDFDEKTAKQENKLREKMAKRA